jgi:hypothetical protein
VNFNPVGSWVHLAEEKAPICVALDGSDCASVDLNRLDLRIGNHRAAVISNSAR